VNKKFLSQLTLSLVIGSTGLFGLMSSVEAQQKTSKQLTFQQKEQLYELLTQGKEYIDSGD